MIVQPTWEIVILIAVISMFFGAVGGIEFCLSPLAKDLRAIRARDSWRIITCWNTWTNRQVGRRSLASGLLYICSFEGVTYLFPKLARLEMWPLAIMPGVLLTMIGLLYTFATVDRSKESTGS